MVELPPIPDDQRARPGDRHTIGELSCQSAGSRERTFAVLALMSAESDWQGPYRSQSHVDRTAEGIFVSERRLLSITPLLHEEIRRADRQKNDFLSMLAHELRNPLAPIRNAAQLLDHQCSKPTREIKMGVRSDRQTSRANGATGRRSAGCGSNHPRQDSPATGAD